MIDGTWQQILQNKYLGTKPAAQAQWKSGDSHVWASLMKGRQEFFQYGRFIIQNG